MSLKKIILITLQNSNKDAPDIWKSMINSNDPLFFYNSMSEVNRQTIDSWMNQKSDLIPVSRQKFIDNASVDVMSVRKSTPFVRAQVKVLRRRLVEGGLHSRNSSALLTIWEPSDDWISLLKEGTAVRLRNVTCRPSQVDSKIQLSTNFKTSLEVLPKPSNSILSFSGYEERCYSTMISLHVLSKLERFQYEFDIVGYRLDTCAATYPAALSSIYVTDESGLLLRVDRCFDSESCFAPPWKTAKYAPDGSSVFSFQNLRLVDFSTSQNCAIALWTESSVIKTCPNSRSMELIKFSKSNEGGIFFRRVSRFLSNSWDQILGKSLDNLYVAVGIVLSVYQTSDDERSFNGSQHVNIVIDCGSDALFRARICLKHLKEATGLMFQDDLCILSKKLRNTGSYFSFVLKHVSLPLYQDTNMQVEVETMSKVDACSLSYSYHQS